MLRTVAISLLAAGCALVSQPPPPGTVMVQAQVRNVGPVAVELGVSTPAGELDGAVQPALLAPRATAQVTFYLPIAARDWWITVNGAGMFPAEDANQYVRQQCRLFMEVNVDGSGGIGCSGP
jgi:hypothetical protein